MMQEKQMKEHFCLCGSLSLKRYDLLFDPNNYIFQCKLEVTALCWNPVYNDLFAVAFGSCNP